MANEIIQEEFILKYIPNNHFKSKETVADADKFKHIGEHLLVNGYQFVIGKNNKNSNYLKCMHYRDQECKCQGSITIS